MLDALHIGLTGLTGYSKDLSVIGNNAANLNTPGYKSQQLLFADLFYQSQVTDSGNGQTRLDLGAGLGTGATRRNFTAGDLRKTGGAQDVAIEGNGLFVLRRDGQVFYTRAGQFSFDADGFLVAQGARNARVAALAGGGLRDINITGLRTRAGQATQRVQFNGVLNLNEPASTPVTLSNVAVIDAAGGSHTLTVLISNNSAVLPGSWLVEVRSSDDVLLDSGEIRFSGNGTPEAGFNSRSFSFAPAGAAATTVELYFGDPGSRSGATSLSASSSTLAFDRQDGFALGSLLDASFAADGVLTLRYSNGQSEKTDQLALASFSFEQGLAPVDSGLFTSADDNGRLLGTPNAGPFGSITAGAIEISNVDLAQEFSALIISQRGYQASSQVIGAANEMIQQLFDLKQRR